MARVSVEVVDAAGVTRFVRAVDAKEILALGGSYPAHDKDPSQSSQAESSAETSATPYAKMRKADLVALAAEKGIEVVPDDVTVAQIIALLEESK